MNIGEQIIAAIANGPLIRITNAERNDWNSQAVFVWSQSAAEQLEAVVEAHIEERVRVRLELDRQAIREKTDRLDSALTHACQALSDEFGGGTPDSVEKYRRFYLGEDTPTD